MTKNIYAIIMKKMVKVKNPAGFSKNPAGFSKNPAGFLKPRGGFKTLRGVFPPHFQMGENPAGFFQKN